MKKLILLPILGLMLVYGCGKKEAIKDTKEEKFCIDKDLKEKITIEPVQKRAVSESINLTGNITYNNDHVVQFNSLVEGIITKTTFSLGDYVKKGQVLAEIKSTELNGMQSESKSLQSQLSVAQRQLQATKSMFDDGIASQKDLMQAQSELDVLKSSLENVRANLAMFSASSERAVFQIKAPTEGYVVAKNISPGMQITEGSEPLFTISDLKEIWVLVNVYTSNLKNVTENMLVDVTTPAYPGEIFKGKITMLAKVFDADEHVLKARIVMENKNLKLKPGMTADIIIDKSLGGEMLAAVPAKAAIFDNNRDYILIYKDDCTIETREINPTIKNNNWIYFDKGVKEGEMIITKNHLLIHERLKN
ncbi:efflux RND transporter periplasmic adaptor subunit [Flavobacterium hydatis]|uniref:Efflux transporter periplasmic adaptor subunit n=1 Tax=Flavobacterium hydatis TaxID=991 RepID=A0A086AGG6_FLAHY|nr:efflux RND transporter periplasmic adaptor subunit [Flavobacterium hydatis]KFF15780.1 RND transporter [Flavobacterium hydatis]OXA85949.1 efflux transporter periplasmic adaptor subunit [Flavobacterium hydatis]